MLEMEMEDSLSNSAGDIIMIGLDMDNSKDLFWYKWNLGCIRIQEVHLYMLILMVNLYYLLLQFIKVTNKINFGGYASYTISSAASDADGYGTFEYAPPSGYYALCTKNLEEFG